MRTTTETRSGARPTALLAAAVLAASGIAATMAGADAAVTARGGENAQGTPSYYRDAEGLALQLCTDGNANLCEPAVGDHIGVYFSAEAARGPLRAIYGVEAVQNADNPAGDPLVSNGARFRVRGARPNTTYTIKDPWRTTRFRTNGQGDADVRRETGGDPDTVRNGHVSTFLHAVSRRGADFIGSANLTTAVFGSPSGFNKVRMTGGGQTLTIERFTLMGQKRDNTAMSSLNRRSLRLGNGTASAVTRSVRYSSFGTAAARPTVRKGGTNPGAFSVRETCASQAPGSGCDIIVTFRPREHANSVRRAFLTIDDNGLAAPRRVSLTGVGVRR